MKRKILLALLSTLCLCFCIIFTACGDTTAESTASNSSQNEKPSNDTPQDELEYTLSSDGTYYIVSNMGTCSDAEPCIPSVYNDKPVKAIGKEAFSHRDITSITIPDSVTSIGEAAFSECSHLISITIPSNVTSIGDSAFENCTSLTSVTIGDGVTSIGDYAFYCCTSLTSISIPNSIKSIGYNAFDGFSELGCNVYDNGYYMGNEENPYLVFVRSKGTEITSCEINENTKVICSHAFYHCFDLTSVTVPNSITSIGTYAFRDCTSLEYNKYNNGYYLGNEENPHLVLVKTEPLITSFEINKNTICIFDDAFSRHIISINVDEENEAYTSIDGNLYSKDQRELIQYAIGKTDESFEIPNSVTSIGDYAFYECTSLTSVEMPSSIISIGQGAFSYCSLLTNIVIPSSVTSIDYRAFEACYGITSITIPSSVTSIKNFAFDWCENLTIYCEAESQPSGWDENWNYSNCSVIWNCNETE